MNIIGSRWTRDGATIVIVFEIEPGSPRAKFSSSTGERVFCAEHADGSSFDVTEKRLITSYTKVET